MKIGLRSIKTGIAVSLTIIICNLMNLESSFFGAVASIIAMQATIADSFRKGKERLLGTLAGALIGILFSLVPIHNPLWIGFGVVVVITFANWLKWKDSIVLGGIVFCAIMTSSLNDKTEILQYGTLRFFETFIGIIIGIIVNYIIKPPKIDKRVKETIEPLGKEIYRLWFMSVEGYFYAGLEQKNIQNAKVKIDNLFQKTFQSLGQYQKEILYRNINKKQEVQFEDVVRSFQHLYDHAKSISKIAYNFQGKPLVLCESIKDEADVLLAKLRELEYYVSYPLISEKQELVEETFRVLEEMKQNIQRILYQQSIQEEFYDLLEFFTMIYHMERFMSHMKDF